MQSPSPPLSAPVWIALAAHALAHRWPHILPVQLDEVAAELHRDDAMRALEPAEAVALWLRPLDANRVAPDTVSERFAA